MNITDKENCSGCHACYNVCPKQCITMIEDEEGFLYPHLDQELCIGCGSCKKVCPFEEHKDRSSPIDAYAAKCSDNALRYNSSSGGIFSLLANRILADGGIVFGAAFSDDFREVVHVSANKNEDIDRIRSSKYVQSRIEKSYRNAKEYLDGGKKVLFSGTPCQIAGLKKYIKKEYEDLFCVDVICHGVPSPKLWKYYLDSIEKKYKGNVVYVNFRRKKSQGQSYGIGRTESGVDMYISNRSEPYMKMFLNNYSLRPSCYSCRIKKNGSYADISLGDFWGIEYVCPDIDDSGGVSAVIINTEKGKRLYNEISSAVEQQNVLYDDIVKYNKSIIRSPDMPEERFAFFTDLNSMKLEELTKKYCRPNSPSIRQRLKKSKVLRYIRFLIRPDTQGKFEYGLMISLKSNK